MFFKFEIQRKSLALSICALNAGNINAPMIRISVITTKSWATLKPEEALKVGDFMA